MSTLAWVSLAAFLGYTAGMLHAKAIAKSVVDRMMQRRYAALTTNLREFNE